MTQPTRTMDNITSLPPAAELAASARATTMPAQKPIDTPYKRVLLKFGGEALAGENGVPIDTYKADVIARKISEVHALGVQIAIVIGGGNLWRGSMGAERGMDRSTADHIGMLGTVMNALAVQDSLVHIGIEPRVQSAVQMNSIAEPYIRKRAIRHMEKGRVVIMAGGTGNPFFSTDSAGALRASDINADILIKATKVNGVYSADPHKDPTATRYSHLTYDDVITNKLSVMDMTAFTLCQENNMPIMIVDFWEDDSLRRAIQGDTSVGTLITASLPE